MPVLKEAGVMTTLMLIRQSYFDDKLFVSKSPVDVSIEILEKCPSKIIKFKIVVDSKVPFNNETSSKASADK